MPALPHLASLATSPALSTDTRTQDSRQLLRSAARHLASSADRLFHRHANSHHPTILPRQSDNTQGGMIAIPTVYQGLNAGPAPGVVVGIILGSVAGFLLLIWLLWVLSNSSDFFRSDDYQEEDVVVSRRQRSRSRRSSRRTEMVSRSPVRRERVIRQERIVRDIPQPVREPSRIRETVIVDDGPRRVDGDDIVEVIEEHSSVGGGAPPRRKSRRASGYR